MERKWGGYYVAVEGIEGCGKTTQAEHLAENLRRELGNREVVLTQEPGGCNLGSKIREVLELEMEPEAEAYCFATARAQSIREIVRPALDRGAVVVSDRSIYSSFAYQGGGRKLGRDRIWEINKEAVGETLPDQIILIDLPVEVGLARKEKDESLGRLIRLDNQKIDFYREVRRDYLEMAYEDSDRWVVVDGQGRREEIATEILGKVLPRVKGAIGENENRKCLIK